MKLRKPYRISVTANEPDYSRRPGYSCMVTGSLKIYRNNYQINLYMSDIKQLHLSCYITNNVLSVIRHRPHTATLQGGASLLFRVLLPHNILREQIVVKRRPDGIAITLYKKSALPKVPGSQRP